MNKAPLLEELLKYHKENNLILSMPGNKCGKAFLKDDLGKEFINNLGYLDITEVGNLDNLHCPEGVIDEAQKLLAKTYGCKKAYFLVNGSTSGNLASIFSAFNEGDTVLVERNCHKSIYNAIILRKLKVVYLEINYDEVFCKDRDYFKEKIDVLLKENKDIKGIILTNSNYLGISYKLDKIIDDCIINKLKIILDNAHGAHYICNDKLPSLYSNVAHYVIVSAHKTMPSLTQGAFLLVNDINSNIDFYVKSFTTTSPSYLIMSSLDYARQYLDVNAKNDYEDLIKRCDSWKEKINSFKKVKIIKKEDLNKNYYIDSTRYVMLLDKGFSGHKLFNYFKANNIQAEMSFSNGVVLILSPINTEDDFKKIYDSIKKLNIKLLEDNLYENDYIFGIKLKKCLEPFEAFEKKYEIINLNYAVNKIAKENIILYPPGTPLVVAGEKISKEVVKIIYENIENKIDIIGIDKFQNIKVIIE